MSNRREFISRVATFCVAGVSIGKLTGAHAAMVSESDPNAKALGYIADASNAKKYLSWKPKYPDIEQSILHAHQWLKKSK